MQCDCLTNQKKLVTEHVAKQGVVNPRVEAQFAAIMLDGSGMGISLTYTIRGDNRPYNTQKGQTLNMLAKFCPFCGKSIKKEEPANAPS